MESRFPDMLYGQTGMTVMKHEDIWRAIDALAQENGGVIKIERRALGGMGVAKLWPVHGERVAS